MLIVYVFSVITLGSVADATDLRTYKYEALGCFNEDASHSALPHEVLNVRASIALIKFTLVDSKSVIELAARLLVSRIGVNYSLRVCDYVS